MISTVTAKCEDMDEDQKKLTQQSCVYLDHVGMSHFFTSFQIQLQLGAAEREPQAGDLEWVPTMLSGQAESWHEHVIKHEQTDFHGAM